MDNEETETDLAGMYVHIAFADAPDEKLYRYISFQTEDSDNLAVRDEDTFYYACEEEITHLLCAVRDGDTKFYVDADWFIFLEDGFVPEYLVKTAQ